MPARDTHVKGCGVVRTRFGSTNDMDSLEVELARIIEAGDDRVEANADVDSRTPLFFMYGLVAAGGCFSIRPLPYGRFH